MQGIGYTLAAFSPPLIGLIHEGTGGWTMPIIVLSAVAAVGIVAGMSLSKPRFVEEDFATNHYSPSSPARRMLCE